MCNIMKFCLKSKLLTRKKYYTYACIHYFILDSVNKSKSLDIRAGGGEIAMEILGMIIREHRTPDGNYCILKYSYIFLGILLSKYS